MGWFDLVVAALLAGFGLALALVLAVEGATAIRRWRDRWSSQRPG